MTTSLNIPLLHTLRNQTIIVGFSGGPDSVFLLTQLQNAQNEYGLIIIAAHLDHQWRTNSGDDALWCKNFCHNLNIPFISKKSSELNFSHTFNGSKEELGREQRRFFFQECLQKCNAHVVALAHHQDDQIETFFIRLARGTSIVGISGMKEHDGVYIRPLLSLSKAEILHYLQKHNIDYLQDSTNHDEKYLRNRIRKYITPHLATVDERLHQNIISCMKHLQKTDAFLNAICKQTIHALLTPDGIDTEKFLNLDEILQQRILLKLLIDQRIHFTPSQAFFREIMKFLHEGKQKKHKLGVNLCIAKKQGCFSFCKQTSF